MLLFYVHGKQPWSCREGKLFLNLLFLRRIRPPCASCTYFRQYLTTAEEETKVCGPGRVSNPGPLALELDALLTALRGPAHHVASTWRCLMMFYICVLSFVNIRILNRF